MPQELNSINQEELFNLLSKLSGHLQAASPKDEKSISSLQKELAAALPGESINTIKNNLFAFENSDLFFTDKIPAKRLNQAKRYYSKSFKEGTDSNLRVFAREVPVRSSQLKGSVPAWAQGAAVENTLGPFTNKDGKKIWFDFYKIEKLIAFIS